MQPFEREGRAGTVADEALDAGTVLGLDAHGGVQVALSAQGGFLLVAREYSMTAGAVFATGSTEPLLRLPEDASSVWLPR